MPHLLYDAGVSVFPLIPAAIAALFLMQYAKRAERRVHEIRAAQHRMIVDLSHNLQTPLAVLRGKVEKIEQSILHDGHTASLRQSVDSITRFVNDILAFTSLDERLKEKEKTLFSLSELVQEICEEITDITEDESIFLVSEMERNIYMLGSERHLRDAVMNLLGNAIKYMGNSTVRRIRVSLEGRGGQILLTVSDTGMGIPENELPHVFERFYRGSNRVYGSIPGTGLGLAIVERIVKEHGGSITVSSEVGKGSTFTLILPPVPQGYLRNRFR